MDENLMLINWVLLFEIENVFSDKNMLINAQTN
jgi:hypothetical protein